VLCAGLAVAALGPWGALIAAPAGFAGAYLLIHALPVIGLAARTTPAILGTTLLRSRRMLPESVEWELFRLVDLVKGRLWAAAPGVECGPCEVWVVPRASEVAMLLRASRVGVGLVGAPICAVREGEAADEVAALEAISRDMALNAAGCIRSRAGAFLRSGLHGYFLACARTPRGPRRSQSFHREAWLSIAGRPGRADGLLVREIARRDGGREPCHRRADWPCQPHPPALRQSRGPSPSPLAERGWSLAQPGTGGEVVGTRGSGSGKALATIRGREALARSFTAFLIGRYGWPAYLRLLRHADSHSPSVALHLTYGRTPAELERRWLVFLESVQTGQAAGEGCA